MNKVLLYTQNYNLTHLYYSNLVLTNDLSKFLNSAEKCKIAVINIDHTALALSNMITLLDSVKYCDFVVVYTVELNNIVLGLINKFNTKNFYFIVGGVIHATEIRQAQVEYNPYWLMSTVSPYLHDNRGLLMSKNNSYVEKPFAFEVMYGLSKPHRTYVHNYIQQSELLKTKVLESRFLDIGSVHATCIRPEDSDFWEDDIVRSPNNKVIYQGVEMPPSQVMPFKVYNRTAFSIVCESEFKNDFSFITEKIAKPLVARRLFVVISGKNYLKSLRMLGFKTFDGIIDESYDTIDDNHTRFNAALKQVEYLSSCDQKEVFRQIYPIVEHNFEQIQKLSPFPYKVETAIDRFLSSRDLFSSQE